MKSSHSTTHTNSNEAKLAASAKTAPAPSAKNATRTPQEPLKPAHADQSEGDSAPTSTPQPKRRKRWLKVCVVIALLVGAVLAVDWVYTSYFSPYRVTELFRSRINQGESLLRSVTYSSGNTANERGGGSFIEGFLVGKMPDQDRQDFLSRNPFRFCRGEVDCGSWKPAEKDELKKLSSRVNGQAQATELQRQILAASNDEGQCVVRHNSSPKTAPYYIESNLQEIICVSQKDGSFVYQLLGWISGLEKGK